MAGRVASSSREVRQSIISRSRQHNTLTAVTIARIAAFHRLPVAPFSLSTAPVPLHKPRVRHELPSVGLNRISGGFRLRLGARGCASASRRYALLSALRSLPPVRRAADRSVCVCICYHL